LQIQQEETVTIVHQFKLAHKLALAVLQYHSTPWLPEYWDLSQLLLFMTSYGITDEMKLYLNSSLPELQPKTEVSLSTDVRMIDAKSGQLGEAIRQGIKNVTLFCLAVAFLDDWTLEADAQTSHRM
jgi:hypothetical protein